MVLKIGFTPEKLEKLGSILKHCLKFLEKWLHNVRYLRVLYGHALKN